jgi:hypothetical protein
VTQTAAKLFEATIIELMHILGWRVASFRPALTKHGWRTAVSADGKGYPDMTAFHPVHGILYAELKTGKGRLEPEQIAWRDWIVAAGGRWHLWTDKTPMSDIAHELRCAGTHTAPAGMYPLIDPQSSLFEEAS